MKIQNILAILKICKHIVIRSKERYSDYSVLLVYTVRLFCQIITIYSNPDNMLHTKRYFKNGYSGEGDISFILEKHNVCFRICKFHATSSDLPDRFSSFLSE